MILEPVMCEILEPVMCEILEPMCEIRVAKF